MIEEAIISHLLLDSDVSDLVAARIYPSLRPQGQPLPAITLQRIDGAPLFTDDGNAGLEPIRLQFDCWARTYKSAKLTARAVIAALNGFDGPMNAVNCLWVELDAERDMPTEGGTNVVEYPQRVSLDFSIWVKS